MNTPQGADLLGHTVKDVITGFEGVVTGFGGNSYNAPLALAA